MKKHSKRLAMVGIMLVCILRIIYVNIRYPGDNIHYVEMGRTDGYMDQITMKIESIDWIPFKDAEYGFTEETDGYYCIVSISLHNQSDTMQKIDLTQLYIEGEGYLNGISMEIYVEENEGKSMHPDLFAGEELKLRLPYTIYDFQWKPKDWKTIKEKKFCIIRYSYPDKWVWKIS